MPRLACLWARAVVVQTFPLLNSAVLSHDGNYVFCLAVYNTNNFEGGFVHKTHQMTIRIPTFSGLGCDPLFFWRLPGFVKKLTSLPPFSLNEHFFC